jgi:hypothetical protein
VGGGGPLEVTGETVRQTQQEVGLCLFTNVSLRPKPDEGTLEAVRGRGKVAQVHVVQAGRLVDQRHGWWTQLAVVPPWSWWWSVSVPWWSRCPSPS